VGFTPWQWIANPAFSSLPIEPAATPASVSAQDACHFLWGEHPMNSRAILLDWSRQFYLLSHRGNGKFLQKANSGSGLPPLITDSPQIESKKNHEYFNPKSRAVWHHSTVR
jgi:hypothetical protein